MSTKQSTVSSLAAFGAADQVPLSGVATIASTAFDQTGPANAMRQLIEEAFSHFGHGQEDRTYREILDGLSAERLGANAASEVRRCPATQEHLVSLAEIEKRQKLFDDVLGDRPGANSRAVLDAIRLVPTKLYAELGAALERAIEACPEAAPTILSECRKCLKDIPSSSVDGRHASKFRHITSRIRELHEFDARLGLELAERVRLALVQEARITDDLVIKELASKVALQHAETLWLQFESYLKSLEASAASFSHQRAMLCEHYDDAARSLKEEYCTSGSALRLNLPGPSLESFLQGCARGAGVDNHIAFVNVLSQSYEDSLRDLASSKYNHPDPKAAPLLLLIGDLSDADLIRTFDEAVERYIYQEQSVWAAIRSAGIDDVVLRLWNMSEKTAFRSFDEDAGCGISPIELPLIVSPRPLTADDVKTADDFQKSFRQLAGDSACFLFNDTLRDVLIARLSQGYILAIEESNLALLQGYCAAATFDHAPHIPRFFEESPDGRPIENVVEFGNSRLDHSKRNSTK